MMARNISNPNMNELNRLRSFLNYSFIVPRRAPVGEIRYSRDRVKYIKSPLLGTLWDIASNGSRLVHTNGVIATPPDSSTFCVRTTLQPSKRDVLIVFSSSVNVSGLLFGV